MSGLENPHDLTPVRENLPENFTEKFEMKKIIKLAIFTFALFLAANVAAAQDQLSALKWFYKGKSQLEQKSYAAAIDSFSNCIRLQTEDIGCYLNRGTAYYQSKLYDQAIADFGKAIQATPGEAFSYLSRGTAYYAQLNFNAALADFSKAIDLQPVPAAYFSRSLVYCRQGKTTLANADEQKAARLGWKITNPCTDNANQTPGNSNENSSVNKSTANDQRTADRYYNSGKKLFDKKDFDGAIRDFTEAIRLKPDYSLYYNFRADAYEAKNLLDRALTDYTKAIELKKDYSLNYSDRSKVYRKLKRYLEALNDIENAIKFKTSNYPDSLLFTDKIEIYREMKDYPKALEEVDKLVARYENSSGYLIMRAEIRTDLNNKRGAISDYTKIIEDLGNLATLKNVYLSRSALYKQLGEYEKAEQDLQNYSKTNFLLGEIKSANEAASAGNVAKAIGILSKILADNSTNSYLYFERGTLYAKTNEAEKAAADFRNSTRCATRSSDNYYKAESHKKLAQYHYKKAEYKDALFEINESMKINALRFFDNSDELRGSIYFKLGEYQKAIEDFEKAKKNAAFFFLSQEGERNLNEAYCKTGNSKCRK